MKYLAFGALCAASLYAPTQGATWFLQFSANTTGTYTEFCMQQIPECMLPTVTPISRPVSGFFTVEEFMGTKMIEGQQQGAFGGRVATYSFALSFDGTNLQGTGFSYFEGGTGSSPNLYWQTTAPSIAVTGVAGQPGPVPESSAWALLITGFAALGATLRRSRRYTSASGFA